MKEPPTIVFCYCGERIYIKRGQIGSHITYSFHDVDNQPLEDRKCPFCGREITLSNSFTQAQSSAR